MEFLKLGSDLIITGSTVSFISGLSVRIKIINCKSNLLAGNAVSFWTRIVYPDQILNLEKQLTNPRECVFHLDSDCLSGPIF